MLMTASLATADDWPIWRGPAENGISEESDWDATAAEIKWKKELGEGYSSVSVKDGKLYTAGFIDGKDIVYCLNEGTGEEIWKYSYPSTKGSFVGPRATPVIDGDCVYMVSRDGVVYCLNVSDGGLKWKTEVLKESENKNSQWGIATSAVIEDDLVLLNIGARGTALNKETGEIVWKSKGDQSYASPVVVDFNGKTCAFVFAAQSLEVVDVKTGEAMGSYEWTSNYGVNGADPLLIEGKKVFITTGYQKGCAMIDYSTGDLKKVWENNLIQSQFSSCVEIDGFIYGVDGQTKEKGFLRCISVEDGTEKWNMRIGFGSLMAADGKLIALGEKGTLYFANATPDKYDEIAQFDTGLKQLCWTQPVLANGVVYCRNDKGLLVAVDVSK